MRDNGFRGSNMSDDGNGECRIVKGRDGLMIKVCHTQEQDMSPRSINVFQENGKFENYTETTKVLKSLSDKGVKPKELIEINRFAKNWFRCAKETDSGLEVGSGLFNVSNREKRVT